MRSRPRPNPRRGLLRAAIVVVLLIALLVIAMLIVSSLLAPKVQAPTTPITPGPIQTPGTVVTPRANAGTGTPNPGVGSTTLSPTAKPGAAPTAAPTKAKKLSLAPLSPPAQWSPRDVLRQIASTQHRQSAVPRWAAFYSGPGDGYSGRRILVRDRFTHRVLSVPTRAYPFMRPVWSPGQRSLYFVTVKEVAGVPGAAWTLERWDRASGAVTSVTTARAMGLIPLGQTREGFLYVLSRGEDSVVNAIEHGKPRFVTILITQSVSSAVLAPDGNSIAFTAPSSCSNCTVDIFDLVKTWIWYGPSGTSSDLNTAWTADGSTLVTSKGTTLLKVNLQGQVQATFSIPAGLPRRWTDPMLASISGRRLLLTNEVTGKTYTAFAGQA